MNQTSPISIPEKEGFQRPRFRFGRTLRRIVLLVVIPLIAVAIGVEIWLSSGGAVSTDDAYVRADKIAVVPRVSGRVTEVMVHENEPVKAGQVMFRIDQEPYKLALARADAELDATRLDIESLRSAYRARVAQLKAAQDSADYWTHEFQRNEKLVSQQAVSQAKYDQVHNYMDMARFMSDSMQQSVDQTLKALGGDPNIATDNHPKVKAAIAARDRAALELSYTDVTAPVDAVIGREELQPGAWVQIGAPAFDVFARDTLRVEANFKETDLTDVKPGQKVELTVDTYPSCVFRGRVDSIAPATGAEYALLPAQNASGNWVKVVQRIPLRILVDPSSCGELRSGMSASVSIATGTEHHLADLLPSFLGGGTPKG